MRTNLRKHLIIVGIFLFILDYSVTFGQGLSIFSAEEAKQLNLENMEKEEWRRYINEFMTISRYALEGPIIIIEQPKAETGKSGISEIKTASPLSIRFSFQENPLSRTPIDMASLQVTAKKSIFTRDLTQKLKPYIKGTKLEATNVEIPSGKFHIEISIADTDGQKTVERYLFVVKKK